MRQNTIQLINKSFYNFIFMILKMRSILLAMLLNLSLFCFAQIPNKQQPVKINSKVLADSFYCNGKVLAQVNSKQRGEIIAVYGGIGDNHTLIEVRLQSYGEGKGKVFYYNYYFPDLNLNCDDIKMQNEAQVHETICKYTLLNKFGLDTLKVETFVAIKSNVKKKIEEAKNAEENFKIVERDKTKSISLVGNDIYQDGKIIGTYEELSIESPNGSLKQFQVYNTMKQMVCLSTEMKKDSHNWRAHTKIDNKYLELNSKSKNDLDDLIKYLIDNNYL